MNKLTISGLESGVSAVSITVQYNPKEITIDKVVAWRLAKWEGPDIDAVTPAPKTMSFELMFDTFESGTPIQESIASLHKLSDVDAALKRPSKVKVVWGDAPGTLPAFEGLIESIGVKYTMFDADGVPLRATVGIRIVEARKVAAAATRRS